MESHYQYPRETVENVFFEEVKVDNVTPAAADMSATMTRGLERPTTWTPVIEDAGRMGIHLDGTLEAGEYRVWLQHEPSGIVIEVGQIELT